MSVWYIDTHGDERTRWIIVPFLFHKNGEAVCAELMCSDGQKRLLYLITKPEDIYAIKTQKNYLRLSIDIYVVDVDGNPPRLCTDRE